MNVCRKTSALREWLGAREAVEIAVYTPDVVASPLPHEEIATLHPVCAFLSSMRFRVPAEFVRCVAADFDLTALNLEIGRFRAGESDLGEFLNRAASRGIF